MAELPTPSILFQEEPMLSGKSKISTSELLICEESSVARSFASQFASFLLFKIAYPSSAKDYFVYFQIEICKMASTGVNASRPGRITTKGVRLNNLLYSSS